MKTRSLHEIKKKIRQLPLNNNIDLIIGIAGGGIIPASIISKYFNLPLDFIWLNFRDEHHKPQRVHPELLKPISFDFKNKRILLVDDRSNSGMTLTAAKALLKVAGSITTLVINGPADYSLFNEDCFKMPWEI